MRRGAFLVVGTLLLACGPSDRESGPSARVGRTVYQTNCTACHNNDPRKPGNIGPAVAGSAVDLIEARVVRGEYPPGYAPQRETRLMVPLPHLARYVDDLAAYLAAPD